MREFYTRSHLANEKYEQRGNWALLETTAVTKHSRGVFDRTFWLTFIEYPSDEEMKNMLDSLAIWIGDQFEDNLVFLRFESYLEFGASYPMKAGIADYLNGTSRRDEDDPNTDGFELRCSERDAVKLLMGWNPQ